MWVVRELLRLLSRIAVTVAIAIAIAEARALISGGDTFHTFRIVLMLLGVLLLLLAAGGQGSMAGRKASHSGWWMTKGFGTFGGAAHPEDPTLAPGVVFAASGFAVLALGVLL